MSDHVLAPLFGPPLNSKSLRAAIESAARVECDRMEVRVRVDEALAALDRGNPYEARKHLLRAREAMTEAMSFNNGARW